MTDSEVELALLSFVLARELVTAGVTEQEIVDYFDGLQNGLTAQKRDVRAEINRLFTGRLCFQKKNDRLILSPNGRTYLDSLVRRYRARLEALEGMRLQQP